MPLLTKKQHRERFNLHRAMRTIVKVKPEQLADKIHNYLIFAQGEPWGEKQLIDEFKGFLDRVTVPVGSGNKRDGWRTRLKYLTANQKEAIGAWVELIYITGGQFCDKGISENMVLAPEEPGDEKPRLDEFENLLDQVVVEVITENDMVRQQIRLKSLTVDQKETISSWIKSIYENGS